MLSDAHFPRFRISHISGVCHFHSPRKSVASVTSASPPASHMRSAAHAHGCDPAPAQARWPSTARKPRPRQPTASARLRTFTAASRPPAPVHSLSTAHAPAKRYAPQAHRPSTAGTLRPCQATARARAASRTLAPAHPLSTAHAPAKRQAHPLKHTRSDSQSKKSTMFAEDRRGSRHIRAAPQ